MLQMIEPAGTAAERFSAAVPARRGFDAHFFQVVVTIAVES